MHTGGRLRLKEARGRKAAAAGRLPVRNSNIPRIIQEATVSPGWTRADSTTTGLFTSSDGSFTGAVIVIRSTTLPTRLPTLSHRCTEAQAATGCSCRGGPAC